MKDNKFILGLLVGILVCLFCVGAFYLGTRYANKTDQKDNPDIKEEKKEDLEFKDLALDDSLVLEAEELNPHYICGGSIFLKYYTGKSVKVDQLKDELKIEMIFNQYGSDVLAHTDKDDPVFSVKDKGFDKYFEDLSFLDSYKDGETYSLASMPATFEYKDGLFRFTSYATGCEGAYEGDVSRIVSARKNDEQLVVNYVVFYVTYDYEKETIDSYLHEDDKKPVEKNIEVDKNNQYVINSDLYDHYEFVYDITNGNLRLESINYLPKE